MVGCFSFRCFPMKSSSSPSLHCARIVHVSGFVEDFHEPVAVREVVGGGGAKEKPPSHFLCTAAHLLSFGTHPPPPPPLRPEDVLERGRLYFLIPNSIFHTDSSSPTDLVSLAARLTAVANRTPSASSSAAKPSRLFLPSPTRVLPVAASGLRSRNVTAACRASSWKPGLETIGEKSFDRR